MTVPNDKSRRRIVVIEQIHCTSGKNMPAAVESRFYRFLESDDEPYIRLVNLVDSSAVELNYAWVNTPSMVHFKNVGKTDITLSVCGGKWKIRPGESMRGEPMDRVFVSGPGIVEVGAFPQ